MVNGKRIEGSQIRVRDIATWLGPIYDGRMDERKGNDVSDLSTVFAVVVIVVSYFSVVVEDIAGSQSTLITDSDRKAASR